MAKLSSYCQTNDCTIAYNLELRAEQYADNNVDSLVHYKNESIELFILNYDFDNALKIYSDLFLYNFYAENFDECLSISNKVFNLCNSNIHIKSNEHYGYILANLGAMYILKKNYSLAIKYIEYAVDHSQKYSNDINATTSIIILLSNLYQNKGELGKSLTLILDRLQILEKNIVDVEEPIKFRLVKNVAIALKLMGRTEDAIYTLEKMESKVNDKLIEQDPVEIFGFYLELALLHSINKNRFGSKQAMEIAIKLKEKYSKISNLKLKKIEAEIGINLGDYKYALLSAKEGFRYYLQKKYKNDKQKSIHYNRIGRCFEKLSFLDSAEIYFIKSVKHLSIHNYNQFENFSDFVKFSSFNLKSIEIINDYTRNNLNLYRQSGSIKYLLNNDSIYPITSKSIDVMFKNQENNESKFLNLERIESGHKNYIYSYYYLLNMRSLVTDKSNLFNALESSITKIYRDSKQSSGIENLNLIPDSILFIKNDLHTEIENINSKIYTNKNKQILSLNDSLSNLKIGFEKRLNDLNRQIEINYPQYAKLKIQYDPFTLEEFQPQIKQDELVLQFYELEDSILVNHITNNGFETYLTPKEEFHQNIESVISMTANPPDNTKYQKDLELFSTASHNLYQAIFQGIDVSPFKNISVIPYNQVSYLPFELLVTKASDQANSFKELPYLMRSHKIRYAYAASLLNNQTHEGHKYDQLVSAFAPNNGVNYAYNDEIPVSRSSCDDTFQRLTCNQDEVDNIHITDDYEPFVDLAATKGKFLESTNSKILHLASHACIDNENPNFNRIFFADDELTVSELYTMEIPSELAVLSACNTGIGTMKAGEGMINLAKGFLFAGVPSIVSSLWSVNDCSTKDLMGHFYQHIKDGESTATAIQQAKLDYLTNADKVLSHPYYWSGFLLIGNDDVVMDSGSNWMWMLGFSALIFLLFITFKMNN